MSISGAPMHRRTFKNRWAVPLCETWARGPTCTDPKKVTCPKCKAGS